MWNTTPTRPVLDLENHYEDIFIDLDKDNRMWDADDVRNGAYQAVFAGAAGATYGNWNVWQMHDTHQPVMRPVTATWRESLSSTGSSQLFHLKNLMLSRPYLNRVPAPELVVDDSGEGEEHVAATRDSEGRYLMVYAPFGRPVEVDLNGLSGTERRGWWFSPVDGEVHDVSVTNSAGQSFKPPTSGRGNDWVLVVDSEEFPPPGTTS